MSKGTQGEVLAGRFQVEREVGRGAAGIVYRAYDQVSHRHVALKVIGVRGVDRVEEERFTREGRVLAELDHPSIVGVVAYGLLDDQSPYLAMEWLQGEDLAARHRRNKLNLVECLEVCRQVAQGLAAAHRAGVVHRDIKPSNLFVIESDDKLVVKLVDFGLAAGGGDVRLTREGNIIGTPAYMAPEQARGDRAIDHRSDLYSLGATLFELLAARPVHVGPTPIATLARLVTTNAPRLSDVMPEIPRKLDDFLAELLATAPEERPQSADEVADALADLIQDPTTKATIAPRSDEGVASISLSSATRMVTTIVALFPTENSSQRAVAIAHLREHGADAVPLGKEGVVAHLGAKRSVGDEAQRALGLGVYVSQLGARVGVATGRTRVHQSRPVGEVVDRASAFSREASERQVLVDATTSELGRGHYDFQYRGDGSAKVGLPHETGPQEHRGGAPFVGREAELAQLLNAYDRCSDDESPVVASCTGRPGIGKTRLCREVLARLRALANAPRTVVVRCESFGKAHPLGMAAELVRGLIGLGKGADVANAARALDHMLGGTMRNAADASRDRLAQLLAGGLLEREENTRDAIWLALTDTIVRLATQGAVALVIEDAQWADPESIAWLDHLLGRAGGAPLWVLLLARPEFWKEHPKVLTGRDHVRLELRPISKRACRTIAQALLGADASKEDVDYIAKQAAGSPLFAEELARVTSAGGDVKKAPTIESAIQVSLDSLEPHLRDAIARLACFGLSGWEKGLAVLGVTEPANALRGLAGAEMVVEQAHSRFNGEREWAFKHGLVREVAYGSLDDDARRGLHSLAAPWLAEVGEDASTVAKHFELGRQAEQAAEHWETAARHAIAANGLTDAVELAERALAFADDPQTAFRRAQLLDEAFARLDARSPDRETSVRALAENIHDKASQVIAEGARARYDDARGTGMDISERLADARTQAAELELHAEQALCSAALAARFAYAGKLEEAQKEAELLLELAESAQIPQAAVDGHQILAIARQTRGELISALDSRRDAARAAAKAQLKSKEAMLTMNVGFALTTMGGRQEARAAIEEGIQIAQSIGSAGTERHGKMLLLGWSATFGGKDPQLDQALAEVRAAAEAAAQSPWLAPDRATLGLLYYRGMELLREGGRDQALRAKPLLSMAAESYRATEMRDILPVALGLWAEAERRAGDPERAVELASEAAALLQDGAPSLLNEAPVYLALHDAEVDMGNLRGARDAIDQAMPALVRRLRGLARSNYGLAFLTHLPQNAGLIAAAEAYGVVPRPIERLLQRATG